jgi:hypothetical protein
MFRLPVVATVAILGAASPARAETVRYGGELLGIEAAGWTAVAAGSRFAIKPLVGLGAGVILLGPPAAHLLLHDNLGEAGISLGLRGAMPVAGGLVGALIDRCRGTGCVPVGIIVGVVTGYLGAVVIDTVFLAREEVDAMTAPRMFAIGGAF